MALICTCLSKDTVLVDTGSSNTWVGATQPYIQTSTSIQSRDRVVSLFLSQTTFHLSFLCSLWSMGSDLWMVKNSNTTCVKCPWQSSKGTEFNDKISLGSSLTVFGQSIGVATDQTGFDDVDGILGLGPNGLTVGTLSPDTKTVIPTGKKSRRLIMTNVHQTLFLSHRQPVLAGCHQPEFGCDFIRTHNTALCHERRTHLRWHWL